MRVTSDLKCQRKLEFIMLDPTCVELTFLSRHERNSQFEFLINPCVSGQPNFWSRDEVDSIIQSAGHSCWLLWYWNIKSFYAND